MCFLLSHTPTDTEKLIYTLQFFALKMCASLQVNNREIKRSRKALHAQTKAVKLYHYRRRKMEVMKRKSSPLPSYCQSGSEAGLVSAAETREKKETTRMRSRAHRRKLWIKRRFKKMSRL